MIAVDGPAASGIGTLSRRLADYFSFYYLDFAAIWKQLYLFPVDCPPE